MTHGNPTEQAAYDFAGRLSDLCRAWDSNRPAIAREILREIAKAVEQSERMTENCLTAIDNAAEYRAALQEIVEAAEALTRPGSEGVEYVNAARMTNAVQAGARLIGSAGVFPELAS